MRKHLNAMAKIMQELSTRQSKKNKKLADDFNKFYASYWSKYRKVHNLIFYNRRIPIGPGSKITEIIPHINPVCFDSEETYKKFRSLINAALRFYRHPTIPLKQPNRLRDDKMYRAKIKRWEATITKNQKIKGKKRITYWHLSLNDLKLADPNHPDGQKCTCRGCNLIKSHAKSIKQAVYEYRKNI